MSVQVSWVSAVDGGDEEVEPEQDGIGGERVSDGNGVFVVQPQRMEQRCGCGNGEDHRGFQAELRRGW